MPSHRPHGPNVIPDTTTNAPAAPRDPISSANSPVSAPALIRRIQNIRVASNRHACRVIRLRTQRIAARLGLLAPSPLRSAKGERGKSGVSLIASGV
jgi:hypothetical protein